MFENIPKNWKKYKLKDLYYILRGGSPRPIDKYLTSDSNGINWIKIGDAKVGSKFIESTKEKIIPEGKNKSRFVNVGDFILSNSMSFGRPYIMKTEGCIHDGWLVLKEKEKNIIYKDFVYYLLCSKQVHSQFENAAAGGVVSNLNIQRVENVEVVIPNDIREQKEIADVLDAASEIIRLRTACIESAQSLIPALFQEMFGDPLSKVDKNKIGYYFDVGTGATPRRENSEYYEGNIPWVKTTEVDNCYINSTSEHISESAIKETNCSLYPPGTILMAMYGQGKTRGKVAYLNINATTNQACAALQLKKEYENDVNLIYVFYYLQIIYEFLRTLSQGGGRPNMNLSIVRNIPLYLPDIKQQELFAKKVQEIEAYIKTQQAELENAKTMFQSLLHHSFTGELTRRAYGE